MKAKLIKKVEYSNDKEIYYSLIANDKCIGTTHNVFNKEMKDNNENVVFNKLSKQNCDEIFGVFDVDKLAEKEVFQEYYDWGGEVFSEDYLISKRLHFIEGFNKAMELNRFTLENMATMMLEAVKWANDGGEIDAQKLLDNTIQSLQQPTEIEVEIVMKNSRTGKIIKSESDLEWDEDGLCDRAVPKLDSEGCLILKKI